MASSISSFGSSISSSITSNSSKSDKNNTVQFNLLDTIKATPYELLLNDPLDYDIYLDSSRWHWYILVRPNLQGSELPFIIIAITTDKTLKLIPIMRIIPIQANDDLHHTAVAIGAARADAGIVAATVVGAGIGAVMDIFSGTNETRVGSVKITIADICKLANEVQLKMGSYNLFRRNCQHFCNNFLAALGLPTESTTIGPDVTLDPDIIDNIIIIYNSRE